MNQFAFQGRSLHGKCKLFPANHARQASWLEKSSSEAKKTDDRERRKTNDKYNNAVLSPQEEVYPSSMTVVWRLLNQVVVDFSLKAFPTASQEADHYFKVSTTADYDVAVEVLKVLPSLDHLHPGLLAGPGAGAVNHVKETTDSFVAGNIDSSPAPMADLNAHQDGSLVDRMVDDGRSESESLHCNVEKDGVSKEEISFLQSSSQTSGGNPSKVDEEGDLEPARTISEHQHTPLQPEDKEEYLKDEDSQDFKVDVLIKDNDNSTNPYGEQHMQQSAALMDVVEDKMVALQEARMDICTWNESGGNAIVTGVGSEGQYCLSSEEVQWQEKANHVSITKIDRLSSGCSQQNHSTSLREWLSNSARVIDKVENLHIFKQIAEFVELAHSQGVVLGNIRPSSFLLSSLNRVSIIESGSSHTSSSSSEESTGRAAGPVSMDAINQVENELIGSRTEPPKQVRESAQQKEVGTPKESSIIPVAVHGVDETLQRNQAGTVFGVTMEVQRDEDLAAQSMSSGHENAEDVRHDSRISGEKHGAEEQVGKSLASGSSDHERFQVGDGKFPLKQILSMELMWYKSPEELIGGTLDFPSDVYSLGVLFLELFYRSGSEGEWSRAMSDLRHRMLPPTLLLEHPKEAAFCLLLLHPNPSCRPKAREILHADIFSEVEDKLAEREVVMNLEEKVSEAEITLDFLLQVQQEKHVIIQKLSEELKCLNHDVQEVERWQALLMKNWLQGEIFKEKDKVPEGPKEIDGLNLLNNQSFWKEEFEGVTHSRGGLQGRKQELLLAKSAQLMKSFTNLKEFYLSMINRGNRSGSYLSNDNMKQSGQEQRLHVEKLDISRVINSLSSSKAEQGNSRDRLGGFFEDLCKFVKYSRFNVRATLQYGDIWNTRNMVCSLNFNSDDELFATAGACRKIKIFECNALLEDSHDMHYPVSEMNSRRKLSCVCWNNFHKNHLASSDLEGTVQLWDVTAGRTIMEFKEHDKCAWSVDFSHSDPSKLASGSDDCCVKLWSMNQGTSVGTIKTKANVCSVQFPPDYSHLLAFGSADSQVYCHDLRYIKIPVCILTGHQKTVSFIRFADAVNIVSASTDNTLKLWDLTKASTKARGNSASYESISDGVTTFTGHTNVKNFVGLSVAEGSYIACGSETNEVFVYHKSLPVTMLSHKFGYADPISGQEFEDTGGQFVSSVCWRGKSQTLVAANSVGNIKVLEMV